MIRKGTATKNVPEDVSEKQKLPLETARIKRVAPGNVPENAFQGQLLDLIRSDPRITYNEMAVQTQRNRKTVQRHLKVLKEMGWVRRIGPAKGGYWEVVEP